LLSALGCMFSISISASGALREFYVRAKCRLERLLKGGTTLDAPRTLQQGGRKEEDINLEQVREPSNDRTDKDLAKGEGIEHEDEGRDDGENREVDDERNHNPKKVLDMV
jgi:hypothetical protein